MSERVIFDVRTSINDAEWLEAATRLAGQIYTDEVEVMATIHRRVATAW